MIAAIVLAAGTSSRMGPSNKLLEQVQGKPLVLHMVEAVLASKAGAVIVVTGHEAGKVEAALSHLKVTFINNPRYQQGMTTSIQAGVRACPLQTSAFMICLGDMPFVPTQALNLLINTFNKQASTQAIVKPVFEGRAGNPVIFGNSYRKAILNHTEPEGCRGIVQQHHKYVIGLPLSHKGVVVDVDKPEALQKVRQALP